ncbi:PREDICTED: sperm-associated antigen 1-like [Priapulus caudatus]|uniref:Sperm-associated antigen 1-like n=1 Tax=Priapulus caudatus TaxID=37621 RepID=A0ABM1E7F3_PRICU|nr:PREDICTED: sperm-associated antigen 1-like [Priapulus caudatus]
MQQDQQKSRSINLDTSACTTEGLTVQERSEQASKDKDKGNEAFASGDYQEALLYYSRSISYSPLAASYNNRALAHIKLENYETSIEDCNTVLQMEAGNIKALMRRGLSYKALRRFDMAENDLEQVLSAEPHNKRAQALLNELYKASGKLGIRHSKPGGTERKGRRMVIEDVGKGEVSRPDTDCSRATAQGREEETSSKPANQDTNMPSHSSHVLGKGASADKLTRDDENSMRKATEQNNKGGHVQIDATSDSKETVDETSSPHSGSSSARMSENSSNEVPASTMAPTPTRLSDNEEMQPPASVDKMEASIKHMETNLDKQSQRLDDVLESLQSKGHNVEKLAEGLKFLRESVEKGIVDSETTLQSIKDGEHELQAASERLQNEENTVKHNQGEQTTTASDITKSDVTEKQSERKTTEPDECTDVVAKPTMAVQEVSLPPEPPAPLPDKVVKLKDQGNAFFKAGQYADALERYTAAITVLHKAKGNHAGNLSVLYSNRAACYFKTGDCRASIEDCDRALEETPHSLKPLLRKAAAFETMEKYGFAYVNNRHVLSIDCNNLTAQEGATRCAKMLQELQGPGWRVQLPKIPSVPAGLSLLDRTTTPASVQQSVPEPTPAQRFEEVKVKGNAFVQKRNYAAAIECYTECTTLLPDKALGFTNRALCLLKLNKNEQAEQDCTVALVLEPDNVKALFRRAQARHTLQLYKLAMQDLLHLLKLEPSNKAAKTQIETVKELYKQELEKKRQQQKTTPPVVKKRVHIEEVNGNNSEHHITDHTKSRKDEGKNSKDKKSLSKDSKLRPSIKKATPYEFLSAWNGLKKTEGTEPYAWLLSQVKPRELPKVISNKLDGEMLNMIVACTDEHFIDKDKTELAYQYLLNLCQVQRFGMVSMFFTDPERNRLRRIFDKLRERSSGKFTTQEIGILQVKFGV